MAATLFDGTVGTAQMDFGSDAKPIYLHRVESQNHFWEIP